MARAQLKSQIPVPEINVCLPFYLSDAQKYMKYKLCTHYLYARGVKVASREILLHTFTLNLTRQ